MAHKASNPLKWALRIFALLTGLIGVGYIIWALVLQSPPKSSLPVGLLIVGCLALVIALMGVFLSSCCTSCMSVYLLLSFLVTIGELALVITLFVNLDSTVNNLVKYDANAQADNKKNNAKDKTNNGDTPPPTGGTRKLLATAAAQASSQQDKYTNILEIGRYIFLVLIILQFISLLIVLILKIRNPYQESTDDFDEQRAARSAIAQIQMESLKSSVQKSNSKAQNSNDTNFYSASGKMYKSITKKMSQKYGEFTQDPAFQKKWWQGIPGFK